MTATRLAFSFALVLTLSAFVCNAQLAPADMEFNLVNLRNKFGGVGCLLEEKLSQNELEQVGNEQLRCAYRPGAFSITCFFEEETCESLFNTCNDLNGQVTFGRPCEEIVV